MRRLVRGEPFQVHQQSPPVQAKDYGLLEMLNYASTIQHEKKKFQADMKTQFFKIKILKNANYVKKNLYFKIYFNIFLKFR